VKSHMNEFSHGIFEASIIHNLGFSELNKGLYVAHVYV
jgi:hypothetical protein